MGSFIVALCKSIFAPLAFLAYLLLVLLLLLPSCDEAPSSGAARCLCSSPLQKLELGLEASSRTDDFTASRIDSGSGKSGKGDDAIVRTALSLACFPPTFIIAERLLRPACLATTTDADVREIADGNMYVGLALYIDYFAKRRGCPQTLDVVNASAILATAIDLPSDQ